MVDSEPETQKSDLHELPEPQAPMEQLLPLALGEDYKEEAILLLQSVFGAELLSNTGFDPIMSDGSGIPESNVNSDTFLECQSREILSNAHLVSREHFWNTEINAAVSRESGKPQANVSSSTLSGRCQSREIPSNSHSFSSELFCNTELDASFSCGSKTPEASLNSPTSSGYQSGDDSIGCSFPEIYDEPSSPIDMNQSLENYLMSDAEAMPPEPIISAAATTTSLATEVESEGICFFFPFFSFFQPFLHMG